MQHDLKEAHKKIVENMWESADLIDLNYVHNDSLLPGGKIESREAYLAAGEEMRKAFPDMISKPEEVILEGTTTAARWTWRGTHTGTFNGIEATGNAVTFLGMTMYHWKDGKVVEGWTLFEYTHLYRQLGVEK